MAFWTDWTAEHTNISRKPANKHDYERVVMGQHKNKHRGRPKSHAAAGG
ncbi:MAG TPA: hypothetical protein VFT53_05805 [Candidatus Saccharimonadales bacterium]|nr:hypothetical protein [Candidatus Saccharimonadales bacterium]